MRYRGLWIWVNSDLALFGVTLSRDIMLTS